MGMEYPQFGRLWETSLSVNTQQYLQLIEKTTRHGEQQRRIAVVTLKRRFPDEAPYFLR